MERANYALRLFASSFSFLILLLLGFWAPHVAEAQNATSTVPVPVGVILDLSSESAKRCWTRVTMSIDDLYRNNSNYGTRVVLHLRDSQGNAVGAASAAVDLLKNAQVQAIIGPWTSSESAFVAHVGNRTRVPIISFSATSPLLSPARTPFFVRATANDASQAAPIAAFLRAFGWREAVPVYEESDYGVGLLPSLVDAFATVDARVPFRSVLPPAASDDRIDAELYQLMSMQTRVFVVHMSSALGARLFLRAMAVGMMSKGYVWVVTDGIADVLETLDHTTIAAMQGVVGFRPFVNESPDFISGFKSRLRREYPDLDAAGRTVLQLRAYDAARAVATAVENSRVSTSDWLRFSPYENTEAYNSTDLGRLGVSQAGLELLAAILNTTFDGLAGKFRLVGGQLQVSAYEIVNVVGRSTHTVGYWTPRSGIARSPNSSAVDINNGDNGEGELRTIVWPGDPKAVPVGWAVPTNGAVMQIAVPVKPGFKEFVNVAVDPVTNRTSVTGFCIDVFDTVMKKLPYYVPYEYVPYNPSADSYDNLVDVVYNKVFPRGSPLVPDISRAILNVTEGSEMAEIEQKWFGDPTTCPSPSNSLGSSSLDFRSFGGLFLITGTVSALMFLLFLAAFVYNEWDQLKASAASENGFWNKLLAWFKHFDRKECTLPTSETYVDDPKVDKEVNQEARSREAAAIRDLGGSQSPESLSFTPQRPSTTEPSSPRSSPPADEVSVEMAEIKGRSIG